MYNCVFVCVYNLFKLEKNVYEKIFFYILIYYLYRLDCRVVVFVVVINYKLVKLCYMKFFCINIFFMMVRNCIMRIFYILCNFMIFWMLLEVDI